MAETLLSILNVGGPDPELYDYSDPEERARAEALKRMEISRQNAMESNYREGFHTTGPALSPELVESGNKFIEAHAGKRPTVPQAEAPKWVDPDSLPESIPGAPQPQSRWIDPEKIVEPRGRLGDIPAQYESGNLGIGAISSGRGDPGGASYGKFQLASKTGTLNHYLKGSAFKDEFKNLTPGSAEFNNKWKELASTVPEEFEQDQYNYIKNTHYEPLRAKADALGIPSSGAINEALFSMGVQHGGAQKIIERAGIDVDDDEKTVINKLYDTRATYVSNLGSLSSKTKKAVLNRYQNERKDVMAVAGSPAATSAEAQQSIGSSLIEGFNRGVGEFAEGGIQAALSGLGALGAPVEQLQQGLAETRKEKEAQYQQAVEAHPIATRAGYLGGLVGPAAVVPGGVAGKTLTKMGTGALSGATLGAGMYVNEGGSRLANIAAGGLFGGLMPGVMAGAKLLRKLIPGKRQALRDVGEAIAKSGTKNTQEVVDASSRLGVLTTPGEASGSPILKMAEYRIPVTRKTQLRAAEALGERQNALSNKARSAISDIVAEGDDVAKKVSGELYTKVEGVQISKAGLKQIMDDPILMKNFSQVAKDVDYKLSSYPKRSIGQFNELKKYLDMKIQTGKVSGSVNRNLQEAKSKLVDILDDASPDYAAARQISQRIKLKRNFIGELDKAKLEAGYEDLSVDQVYNTLFGTTAKQREFLEAVQVSGGDIQQTKDLMTVLRAISKTPMSRLLTKDPASKSSQFGKGVFAAGFEYTRNFFKGKYNKALLDLALDPKWANDLSRLAKAKEPSKMAARLAVILGRLATRQSANIESRFLNGEDEHAIGQYE